MTRHRVAHRAPGAAFLALLIALVAWARPALAVDGAPALSEALGAMVMDEDGNVLFEKNPDERYVPASITKLMTAICALDSGIALDTPVTVHKVEFPDEPAAQKADFPDGSTISFGDLLRVMLVYSANDCAVLVGETVSGSEAAFVNLMNAKAEELGMTQTHYANTHGLEMPGHLTSARDLVDLGRYALLNYPFIAKTVDTPSVTVDVDGQSYTFESTDELLGAYPGAMGIKTGQVERGVTFLGAVRQNNVTLYTVVLACATPAGRWSDTRALWDWTFGTYEQPLVAGPMILEGRYDYPLRFGWDIAAASPTNVRAMKWPDGPDLTATFKLEPSSGSYVGGEPLGVALWSQGERPCVACTLEARGLKPELAPAHDPNFEVLALHGIDTPAQAA